MDISVNTGKIMENSRRLRDLSQVTRLLREQTEETECKLRQFSSSPLQECRALLRKQEEDLSVLTARLINLAVSLQDIARLYEKTERHSEDSLEGDMFLRTIPKVELFHVHQAYSPLLMQLKQNRAQTR